MGRPDVREAVRRVLACRAIESITITPDGYLSFYVPEAHFISVASVRQTVAEATVLIKQLGDHAPAATAYRSARIDSGGPDLRTWSARGTWVGFVIAAEVVSLFVAALNRSGQPPAIEWSALETVLLVGAQIAHLALMIFLFGRRSNGLRNVLTTTVASLMTFLFASGIAIAALNVANDRSDDTHVPGTIVSVRNSKGNGTHLEARLLGKTVTLTQSGGGKLGTSVPVTFTLGAGAFGARWIRGYGREVAMNER